MCSKIMSQEVVKDWFKRCNAWWVHNGDPQKPHAELTSELCSNGYINCGKVLCDPQLNIMFAAELAKKLRSLGIGKIDWVVGSPYAAITFSFAVARELRAHHAFAEKGPTDPKKMIFKRAEIPKGARVLQIEELITTSGTFQKVRQAILQGNPNQVELINIVGTLVHRPPKLPQDYGGIKVVSLIETKIWAVEQKDCPLCQKGSERLKPKANWAKLTA